jgi:hypothetical protein
MQSALRRKADAVASCIVCSVGILVRLPECLRIENKRSELATKHSDNHSAYNNYVPASNVFLRLYYGISQRNILPTYMVRTYHPKFSTMYESWRYKIRNFAVASRRRDSSFQPNNAGKGNEETTTERGRTKVEYGRSPNQRANDAFPREMPRFSIMCKPFKDRIL